jgi:hypothetical protein
MKKILITMVLAVVAVQTTWAQTGLSSIPKKVNWRDARITDIGVMASDVKVWKMENEQTHQTDTMVTAVMLVSRSCRATGYSLSQVK